MTFREYENLQIGDRVNLPFSSEPSQVVIGAGSDLIETRPVGSAHVSITYVNNYKGIELVDNGKEEV